MSAPYISKLNGAFANCSVRQSLRWFTAMRYTHVENALSLRNVESRVMILTAISWHASSASWTVPRNLSARLNTSRLVDRSSSSNAWPSPTMALSTQVELRFFR